MKDKSKIVVLETSGCASEHRQYVLVMSACALWVKGQKQCAILSIAEGIWEKRKRHENTTTLHNAPGPAKYNRDTRKRAYPVQRAGRVQ